MNSFSPTLDNEITTKPLSFSIIFFSLLHILCLDIFKWTSVLRRGHGSNTSHLKVYQSLVDHTKTIIAGKSFQILYYSVLSHYLSYCSIVCTESLFLIIVRQEKRSRSGLYKLCCYLFGGVYLKSGSATGVYLNIATEFI